MFLAEVCIYFPAVSDRLYFHTTPAEMDLTTQFDATVIHFYTEKVRSSTQFQVLSDKI